MRGMFAGLFVAWAAVASAQTTTWAPSSIAILPEDVRPGEGISTFIPNAAGRLLELDFRGPDGDMYGVQASFNSVGHADVEVPGGLKKGRWQLQAVRVVGGVWASAAVPAGAFLIDDDAPSCSAQHGFPADASQSDEEITRTGVLLAARFLCGHGARRLPAATISINTTDTSPVAFVSGFTINVVVNSAGWRGASAASKIKIMVHEYMHVVQNSLGAQRTATWLREGSAEYVGYRAVDAVGLISYPAARAQQLAGLRRLQSPLTDSTEYGDCNYSTDPCYAMWHLAVDLLCEPRTTHASELDFRIRAADGRIGRWIYGPDDVIERSGHGGLESAEVFLRQWRNGIEGALLGPVARTDTKGAWRLSVPLPGDDARGRWYEQAIYRTASSTAESGWARYDVGSERTEQPSGVSFIVQFHNALGAGSWNGVFQQWFHLTSSEFIDQFGHFRRVLAPASASLGISLWARMTPGALGEGTPPASVPYLFRVTGFDISTLSTDQKREAFQRPPNTGWGGTRLGSDLLVIYFPSTYSAGTYTAGIVLPDGRRAFTSFEFIRSASSNPLPSVTGADSIHEGQPGSPLLITGTGFMPGTLVRWDGLSRDARTVDDTRLLVTLAGVDLRAGRHEITVTNPSPGGGTSPTYGIVVAPD